MKKISIMFIMFLSLLFLAACGSDTTSETETETTGNQTNSEVDKSDWPDKLRFAATGIAGLEQLQLEFEPFRKQLEEALGLEVEFFALSDRATAVTALEYDQVDVIMTGGAEYVMMRSVDEKTQPVAALTRPGYVPLIIAHADSGIKTIEDLKGKRIAMDSVGSTSAYLMPSKMLVDAGFDLDKDIETFLLGKAMYEAFLVGETDALAITKLNYEELVAEEGEGLFTVVAEGPELPNDLIIASPHLPESFVQHLQDNVLENKDVLLEQILITGENDKFANSELVVAEDSEYDGLREAYEALGIEYK